MTAVNAFPPHSQGEQPSSDGRPTEMEDILASIRRIIADDQSRYAPFRRASGTTVPEVAPPQPAPPVMAPPPAVQAPVQAPAVQPPPVPEPVAAPRSAAPAPEMPPAPAHELSASRREEVILAAVAAAASGALLPPLQPASVTISSAPAVKPPAPVQASSLDRDPGMDAALNEIANAGAAAVLRPTFGPAATEPPAPHASEPTPTSPQPTPVPAPAASPARWEPEPEAEPLMSDDAEASIGSSFHELASSIFAQNTEMVEGMMRDMLRPMLKEWLDNNLPTIVERLVRSEIERVARGGRNR